MVTRIVVLLMLMASPVLAQTITVTVNPTWANPTTGTTADGTRIECSVNGVWSTVCTATPGTATKCPATPTAIPIRDASGTPQNIKCRIVRFAVTGDSVPSPEFPVATAPPGAVGTVTWSVIYNGSSLVP